ncbi:MAG TPA: TonB-dependent receptor [Candidatus Sulfotelmatobacter sp.]|nr:TonB-dependent receptor [Candidatus Sulfotelmatobacter sp.]
MKAAGVLSSDASHFRRAFETGEDGQSKLRNLPFGLYHLHVEQEGFGSFDGLIQIRSAAPVEYQVKLNIAAAKTAIAVTAQGTLLDPERVSTAQTVDSQTIADRTSSLPGRSLPDLVQSQPGWVFEGTGVLHPRGSEYQTQFVVDGVPLTENRSPSSGLEIEADDVDSLTVYTAGIPAEYGRKMGGVVEVDTQKENRQGLHGKVALGGGSFETATSYGLAQYVWGKNLVDISADSGLTDRFLNPPVVQNFTNSATTGDLAIHYDRDLDNHDRFGLSLRREFSKFLVPNEQIQEAAGQLQHRDDFETVGIASYQHVFSDSLLADFRFMMRSDEAALNSNAESTPISAFQNRGFREQYGKGTVSYHHGRQEWKTGLEADFAQLHEGFNDVITCAIGSSPFCPFDPGTPPTFTFAATGRDLEQAAFVQDLARFGDWTVSAGVRWDHYQLLVNQNAVSPRLGVARYLPALNVVLHASYDRVFQTPAFENILLASSPAVVTLNPEVLRLPVRPSHGNYFEVGATKAFADQLRLDVNYYRRMVNNFADDDQLLNTSVSFPISFRKASIYGAEAKLDLPHWQRFSGFLSYSYMVGSAYLPVTGGFFLGTDATTLNQANTRFWVTQDQRHTVHGQIRYQIASRVWAAFGGDYGSGLPVEFQGTPQDAVTQYGQAVADRVNFADQRVRPMLALRASAGLNMWQHDQIATRLQGNIENLNNRLNLINFAGLFSGNSVAPPRSYSLRLTTTF